MPTPPAKPARASTEAEAATPSYEQAREELGQIVRQLEAGGATLEESLALWERGEQLAAICEQWLDGAQARLDAARADRTGAPDEAADSAGDE